MSHKDIEPDLRTGVKNYLGELNEICQRNNYNAKFDTKRSGKMHEPLWSVELRVTDVENDKLIANAYSSTSTIRISKQIAAKHLLEKLKDKTYQAKDKTHLAEDLVIQANAEFFTDIGRIYTNVFLIVNSTTPVKKMQDWKLRFPNLVTKFFSINEENNYNLYTLMFAFELSNSSTPVDLLASKEFTGTLRSLGEYTSIKTLNVIS